MENASSEPNGRLSEIAELRRDTKGQRTTDKTRYRAYFGASPKYWGNEGTAAASRGTQITIR
jgi:hypothetical protein